MKKLLFLFLFLMSLGMVQAQPGNPTINFRTADPSGTCSAQPMQYNYTLGKLWGCKAGTWTLMADGGGGGAFPAGLAGCVQLYATSTTFGADCPYLKYGTVDKALTSNVRTLPPPAVTVPITGTTTANASTGAIVGTGTLFLTEAPIGQTLVSSAGADCGVVINVTDNTHLTLLMDWVCGSTFGDGTTQTLSIYPTQILENYQSALGSETLFKFSDLYGSVAWFKSDQGTLLSPIPAIESFILNGSVYGAQETILALYDSASSPQIEDAAAYGCGGTYTGSVLTYAVCGFGTGLGDQAFFNKFKVDILTGIIQPDGGYQSTDGSNGTTGNGFKNGLCVTASGACTGGLLSTLKGTSASIGGGLLTAGTCASGTATVTGATTAMTTTLPIGATYPGDGFEIYSYVSAANTVTVKVCALVALTPTATTYSVAVIQ